MTYFYLKVKPGVISNVLPPLATTTNALKNYDIHLLSNKLLTVQLNQDPNTRKLCV